MRESITTNFWSGQLTTATKVIPQPKLNPYNELSDNQLQQMVLDGQLSQDVYNVEITRRYVCLGVK